MDLQELLDHVGEYLGDRTEMISGDPDELWPDELIVRFLNQAQKILCRRAWCIIDIDHATAGRITLQTGVDVYSLHKSVLRVLDATLEDDTAFLGRADDQALRRPTLHDDAWWPDLEGVTADTGRSRAFATDTATRKLRVYPIPRADENGLVITLRVARLPVTDLTLLTPGGISEVPEDYHMDIADYAAGRCLTQPNVDPSNKVDGRRMLDAFDEVVKEARRDRQRAGMTNARWGFSSITANL